MIDEGERPETLWRNVLTRRDHLLALYTHCLPFDADSLLPKVFPNEAELFQQRRLKQEPSRA